MKGEAAADPPAWPTWDVALTAGLGGGGTGRMLALLGVCLVDVFLHRCYELRQHRGAQTSGRPCGTCGGAGCQLSAPSKMSSPRPAR